MGTSNHFCCLWLLVLIFGGSLVGLDGSIVTVVSVVSISISSGLGISGPLANGVVAISIGVGTVGSVSSIAVGIGTGITVVSVVGIGISSGLGISGPLANGVVAIRSVVGVGT